jgi:hypothetical protein
VIYVGENSSKSQKSVVAVVILGPMAQATLVWMEQRKSWQQFARNREDWKFTEYGSTKVQSISIVSM